MTLSSLRMPSRTVSLSFGSARRRSTLCEFLVPDLPSKSLPHSRIRLLRGSGPADDAGAIPAIRGRVAEQVLKFMNVLDSAEEQADRGQTVVAGIVDLMQTARAGASTEDMTTIIEAALQHVDGLIRESEALKEQFKEIRRGLMGVRVSLPNLGFLSY